MAVVTFDPAAFKLQFSAFSGFSNTLLETNFATAEVYLTNSAAAIVTDVATRTYLLNLLTAHLTQLFNGTNDGTSSTAPTGLVGRVEVAKEGSVHVRADMGTMPASGAWYNQTTYGAAYWAATAKYRTFRYVPAARRCTKIGVYLRPWW